MADGSAAGGRLRRRSRAAGWLAAAGLLAGSAGGCTSHAPPAHSAGAAPSSLRCSKAATVGRTLPRDQPVTTRVPGEPADVAATADGRWEFVSLSVPAGGEVGVVALGQGAPRLVRTVMLPALMRQAYRMALTHDGRLLLVTTYSATVVMNVPALETGRGNATAGVLSDSGTGQWGVAVSANDQYAYVADEISGGLSVFNLAQARRDGFNATGVEVGIVPLVPSHDGAQVGAVDVALSPDGSLAYVTTLGGFSAGRLWVIDTGRADRGDVGRAVLAHAAAGCEPVRLALSPDGSTAWVIAETSNALLAFSTAELRRDPSQALRAMIRVGSEPAGLLLADGGRVALVANSNRGLIPGTGSDVPQTVSVIDTAAALAHRPALLGAVPAGLFPRNLSLDAADGRVLLANFGSGTIEEFPVPAAGRLGATGR